MDITSFLFLGFVFIVGVVYYTVPMKFQWKVLAFSSIVFYLFAAEVYTLIYVLITVISVYMSSMALARIKIANQRKMILIFTLTINFGILAILKYTNLGINTINFVLGKYHTIQNVHWISSLAISFYTLQMTAYLIDVYWGKIIPIENPFKLLLFCIYFPQMISGPISRFDDISYSLFQKHHKYDYYNVTNGLIRISIGLVKKLAISNRLALLVDHLQDDPTRYYGEWIWIIAMLYIFQIYTDFSGCMDIVMGTSTCFDIKLPENFRAPFYSKNTQEFWRRWHITLGTWLKDYIMMPIERSHWMSRLRKQSVSILGKKWGRRIPIFLSMLILWLAMGLWHGNSWKYIIGEGLWFWLVIVASQTIEPFSKEITKRLKITNDNTFFKCFQIVRTLVIYSFGMIFFRAVSMRDAIFRIKQGFSLNFDVDTYRGAIVFFANSVGSTGAIIMMLSFVAMIYIDYFIYNDVDVINLIRNKKTIYRWTIYLLIVLFICLSTNVAHQEFAYAQF